MANIGWQINPNIGDIHTQNGKSWEWNGYAGDNLAISYVKNSMKTALETLIGPNVIQAQINTEDNFGNIEI